ncbi:hypothetical protein HMPREF1548_02680 [Clostridium sp. KLE 1755]|nr:hypothetical protein HMPREF1548_02680 [Clostridium sp. KLE 1755]
MPFPFCDCPQQLGQPDCCGCYQYTGILSTFYLVLEKYQNEEIPGSGSMRRGRIVKRGGI